ncbi:conserved Plasmodium protein, unknown function [Plasmodium ovale wallikeri]|uniref:Uncharacterized protein n=1 Tax=Plasmodium ovale wallikeri TaxID=864142 RepID=A0A1A8ZTY8_PLAOA|nr:conserved Plasmodium protein, unknown function [Plasmodium ovale wallikeri]SBT47754.1 conserved Plasmodium protein, unknown function [Plasmodium ovale wallikeri]
MYREKEKLESSKISIEDKIACTEKLEKYTTSEKKELLKKYKDILNCITRKKQFYENVIKKLAKKNNQEMDTSNDRTSKGRKENFFDIYDEKKRKMDFRKLKKKIIVGYTTEGNAVIINNENFSKLFKNNDNIKGMPYGNREFTVACSNPIDSFNPNDRKVQMMEEQEDKIEEGYLSELSCSSSSVISLNSFMKKEKMQRIHKNRETYAKHKYHDNAFINHKLQPCSDCSSSSFSWHEEQYDDLFYYSNLLREDRHLRKVILETDSPKWKHISGEGDISDREKTQEKKCVDTNNKLHIIDNDSKNASKLMAEQGEEEESPFYNYIYFRYAEKGKEKAYPVFVNTVNGKKKIYNLEKINKSSQIISRQRQQQQQQQKVNKYELDAELFSYKSHRYLAPLENEEKKKKTLFRNIQSGESLKRHRFEEEDLNYSIDKIIHQMEKMSHMEKQTQEEKLASRNQISYNDHFSNFIRKNKDYLKRERWVHLPPKFPNTQSMYSTLKIIGMDGKEIKNKSLDNVLINKVLNKTFGDLAARLGHSFKLPKDKIENIKVFFDGDLCDKNMTFGMPFVYYHGVIVTMKIFFPKNLFFSLLLFPAADNDELGLEDGFQIDVKFPLSDVSDFLFFCVVEKGTIYVAPLSQFSLSTVFTFSHLPTLLSLLFFFFFFLRQDIATRADDSSFSEDSYVLMLPDSYVID